MKRLSLYLFLILFTLQTPSQADDIRDFQIEGMSVRDSLLDYITEDEIKKNTRKTRYKSKKFSVAELEDSMKLKTYKSLLVAFKKNDSKYIIYSITGYSAMEIKSCLNKQKEIYNEISELFTDIKKYDEGKRNHPAYKNSYTLRQKLL